MNWLIIPVTELGNTVFSERHLNVDSDHKENDYLNGDKKEYKGNLRPIPHPQTHNSRQPSYSEK